MEKMNAESLKQADVDSTLANQQTVGFLQNGNNLVQAGLAIGLSQQQYIDRINSSSPFMPAQGHCPNCGYCPHCGRSNHQWPNNWYYGSAGTPYQFPGSTTVCGGILGQITNTAQSLN